MTHSKLASFSIVSVLCLVVAAPALTFASAPGAAATNSDTAETYVIEQNGECIQLEPHGDGSETVEEFYDYRNPDTDPRAWTYSSHGTTDIQENQVSKVFVHNGSDGVSLVFLHDKMNENEPQPHGSAVTMDISQLPDGTWAVQDDTYQNGSQDDNWDTSSSSASIDWMWAENRSDGGAYRGLHNMGSEDAIVVDPAFNEEADYWNSWSWAGDSDNRTTEWVARSSDGTETTLDMSQSITIERGICGADETAPDASADASPTTVAPGDTVDFDASDSTDNVGIASYEWDFDGNGTVDATGETAAHEYDAEGSYDATLTVTDEAGNSDTETVAITVEEGDTDDPPTAALDAPESVSLDSSVTFDASGSSDDEGIVEYRWDTNDDGEIDETTEEPTLERSFSETGDHTVTVTVVDTSDQTNETAATVTVSDETDPTAEASAESTTVVAGDPVEFDGTASTDNDEIISHVWEFGDGNATDGETVTHTYASAGEYDVRLTVTDDAGNEDADNVTVTVEAADEDAPPTADLTVQSSATAGETVEFDASASTDDDGIVEYRWDVDGDDTADETTDAPTLERTFSESGDHTVTVTVVDGNDQTDSATATVTVESSDDEESDGDDGGDDGSDDSDTSDDSSDSDDSGSSNDDSNDSSSGSTNTGGTTSGAIEPDDETASASASRSDDGTIVVTVENAAEGEAVSADVPVGESTTGLRAVELVPANDADRLNVTLESDHDVDAPTGTDAGLYELRTQNVTAVESVTYQFAVDRSALGDSGELRILASDGSGASTVNHTVVENGSTMLVDATTGDVDRVVLATVAPDVSASSVATDSEVTTGQSVTVETTLTNDGHADANRTVELAVDGAVVDSKDVTVPANGVANVSFETKFDSAGDRRISVAGTERTISVASPDGETDTDQPTATVTDDSSSNDTEVTDDASTSSQNMGLAVAGFGVLVIGAAALIRVL